MKNVKSVSSGGPQGKKGKSEKNASCRRVLKFLPNKMASEFFKTINKKPTSPFKKLSELKIKKKYLIFNAEFKDTKFGKSVQITAYEDNEKIKFFLPKRYSNLRKSELQYFINNYIVYMGKEDKMDIIKFIENKEISSESEAEEEL